MILILIKCFPVLLLLFRRGGGMVFYTLKRTTKRSILDIFVKKEKKCCTSNGKYKRQEFILLFLFMFIFIPFPLLPLPSPISFFHSSPFSFLFLLYTLVHLPFCLTFNSALYYFIFIFRRKKGRKRKKIMRVLNNCEKLRVTYQTNRAIKSSNRIRVHELINTRFEYTNSLFERQFIRDVGELQRPKISLPASGVGSRSRKLF